MYQLNYSRISWRREFLLRAIRYMLDEYTLDGFRHVKICFWVSDKVRLNQDYRDYACRKWSHKTFQKKKRITKLLNRLGCAFVVRYATNLVRGPIIYNTKCLFHTKCLFPARTYIESLGSVFPVFYLEMYSLIA